MQAQSKAFSAQARIVGGSSVRAAVPARPSGEPPLQAGAKRSAHLGRAQGGNRWRENALAIRGIAASNVPSTDGRLPMQAFFSLCVFPRGAKTYEFHTAYMAMVPRPKHQDKGRRLEDGRPERVPLCAQLARAQTHYARLRLQPPTRALWPTTEAVARGTKPLPPEQLRARPPWICTSGPKTLRQSPLCTPSMRRNFVSCACGCKSGKPCLWRYTCAHRTCEGASPSPRLPSPLPPKFRLYIVQLRNTLCEQVPSAQYKHVVFLLCRWAASV